MNTIDQSENTFELLKNNKDKERKKDIQKKLTYFLGNYLENYNEENKSEKNSKYEKVVKKLHYFNLCIKKEYAHHSNLTNLTKIETYFKEIINNNNMKEINFVCQCIDTSPGDILDTFCLIIDKIRKYENKQQPQVQQTLLPATEPIPSQENLHEYQENATQNNPVSPLFPDNDDMCQIY